MMMPQIPLAQRMRPKSLDEVIGQRHLLGDNTPIRRILDGQLLPSIILFGEAGIGKTTLATLLAKSQNRPLKMLSAISAGVKEIKEAITSDGGLFGGRPVVFVDEIHRFNKSQQDALLGAVEVGDITLIGATTENPSFGVNNALLSRCQVYRLNPLSADEIVAVLNNAITCDAFLKTKNIILKQTDTLTKLSQGDARRALNLLEISVASALGSSTNFAYAANANNTSIIITDELVAAVAGSQLVRYDKDGDNHYDMISAMIKSVRGSDADAALYWLSRMLVAGEDAAFLARRLVILASEDIGLANPNALLLAHTALQSVNSIGMPEARIILGQVVIYLANSPKSNTSYKAINDAIAFAKTDQSAVPLHLRNGVTNLMKNQGYGVNYIYPHEYPNHYYPQRYLPPNLNVRFYQFGDNQKEQASFAFINWLKNSAQKPNSSNTHNKEAKHQ